MKGIDLLVLKAQIGIASNAELVRRLGISETTLYQHLERNDNLPRPLALACAALAAGLEPYTPPTNLPQETQMKVLADSASTLRWVERKMRDREERTKNQRALPAPQAEAVPSDQACMLS